MFGPHVNRCYASGKRPDIVEHITIAMKEEEKTGVKIKAVSIFVGGPKNKTITLKHAERESLRGFIAENGIVVIAHSAYSAYPWRGDEASMAYIRNEQEVCQQAGISGLVVHLPKLPAEEVVKHIKSILNPNTPDVTLYLETPAVKPSESYYESPDKLNALFAELNNPRIGLCIDTAHLWTCGVPLRTKKEAMVWLALLAPVKMMFHLNDSLRERGVGPDTHAPLMKGKIWGDIEYSESGLSVFISFIRDHNIPCIFERNDPSTLIGDYMILARQNSF